MSATRINKLFLSFRKDLSEFEDKFCKNLIPYSRNGIGNIEAFYYWSIIKHYKPEIVLESGIKHGRSTKVIARTCNEFDIKHFAFDIGGIDFTVLGELEQYKNTKCVVQDALVGFAEVMSRYPKSSVVCVVDGPKKASLFHKLIKICADMSGCKAFIAHDCYPGSQIRTVFQEHAGRELKGFDTCIPKPDFNSDLWYLNNYLEKEIESVKPGSFQSLNTTSQYIGIALNLNE